MSVMPIVASVLLSTLYSCIIHALASPITNRDVLQAHMRALRSKHRPHETTLNSSTARYTYRAPAVPGLVYSSKGQYCGFTVYCAQGLSCIGTGASAKCYSVIEYGGVCDGAYTTCASGLLCRARVDGSGPKKCVPPRVKGNGCGYGYHYCDSELICKRYGKHKRCISVMYEEEDCSKTFMVCAKGLVCSRSGSTRQCKERRAGKGEYCSATAKCRSGLTCVGSGAEAECIAVVGYGEHCSGPYIACKPGLSCRPPLYGTGPKKCVHPRVKGNGCGYGYHFCGDNLECIKWGAGKRCVRVVAPSGDCSGSFTVCKGKAVCTGTSGTRRCVLPTPVYKTLPSHNLYY